MSGHREREQSSASIRYGTFNQYIEAHQQYTWLFRHTLFSIKFQDLVDAIKEGRAIVISDGTHTNKWGTSPWRIMTDTNEAEQWAGLHVTPWIKDDQCVGSRTRDRAKAGPGLVKKIADLTIFNQSKGKSGSYAQAASVGMQNHSKSKSLLHLTSLK
jgi:hypothetical protein